MVSLSETLFSLGFYASALLFLLLTLGDFSLPPESSFLSPLTHRSFPSLSGTERPCSLRGVPALPAEGSPLGGANHHVCTNCSQTLLARSDLSPEGQGPLLSLWSVHWHPSAAHPHPRWVYPPLPTALIGLALLSICPPQGNTDVASHFRS